MFSWLVVDLILSSLQPAAFIIGAAVGCCWSCCSNQPLIVCCSCDLMDIFFRLLVLLNIANYVALPYCCWYHVGNSFLCWMRSRAYWRMPFKRQLQQQYKNNDNKCSNDKDKLLDNFLFYRKFYCSDKSCSTEHFLL